MERRLTRFIDEALANPHKLERFFWLTVAADAILEEVSQTGLYDRTRGTQTDRSRGGQTDRTGASKLIALGAARLIAPGAAMVTTT